MIDGENMPRPNHVLCTHSKSATKEQYCLDSADFKVRPQLINKIIKALVLVGAYMYGFCKSVSPSVIGGQFMNTICYDMNKEVIHMYRLLKCYKYQISVAV